MPTSGANVTASAAPSTISFVYDAPSSTYTITEGTSSRAFATSTLDATQSTPTLNTYKITSGNTTEFLSLVKAGTGAGQTRYVGSGYWQRQTNGATTVEGRYTSFTYGAQTPDAATPRTGAASFDVKLLGVRTFSSTVYAQSGDGTINVDFLSGGLAGSGRFSERNAETGAPAGSDYGWRSYALLSSTANAFTGRLEMDNFGSGALNGAFYGPGAEEIGGAFAINTNSENAVVGTIAGPRGTGIVNGSTSIGSPTTPMFYKPVASGFSATGTTNLSNLATASAVTAVHQGVNGAPVIMYSANGRITQPFPAFAGSLSYRYTDTNSQFLRGALQLDTRGTTTLFDSVVFGFDTAASAVPRTGSASFNVTMAGGVGTPGSALQSLSGNGSLSANFATGALTTLGTFGISNLNPIQSGIGTNVSTGNWTGSGTLSSGANAYSGSITLTGTKTYIGPLTGKFFGPAAEQTGATLTATAGDGSIATGLMTGARGGDQTASQVGLAALTAATVLPGTSINHTLTPALSPSNSTFDDRTIEVTYDPVAKSYQFLSRTVNANVNVPLSQNLAQADVVAAQSNATFTAYRNGTTDARIYNWGAANPQVQLTYTSFAEITKPTTDFGGRPTTVTYYVPFGGQTPNFQIPTTGTATYNGVVYGRGGDGGFVGTTNLSGTSLFTVNFGAGTGDLAMTLTATDTTNIARSLGTYNFRSGSGACPGCSFGVGGIALSADPTQFISGTAFGYFFGVNAAEYGVAFQLRLQSGTNNGATFAGVSVGKKN